MSHYRFSSKVRIVSTGLRHQRIVHMRELRCMHQDNTNERCSVDFIENTDPVGILTGQ